MLYLKLLKGIFGFFKPLEIQSKLLNSPFFINGGPNASVYSCLNKLEAPTLCNAEKVYMQYGQSAHFSILNNVQMLIKSEFEAKPLRLGRS